MKVLVTGGSGRAGKYVIKELVKRNHQVVNGDLIESHQNLENSKVKFKKIKILKMHSLAHYDKVRRTVTIQLLQ